MLGSATELNGKVPPTLLSQCSGYLGIVVPERKQTIDGRCLKYDYVLARVVVRGKRLTR
jgi:hypothetical protein